MNVKGLFARRELARLGGRGAVSQLIGATINDTYNGKGWLDLSVGTSVVSLPDFGERYYVFQMTDIILRRKVDGIRVRRSAPIRAQ